MAGIYRAETTAYDYISRCCAATHRTEVRYLAPLNSFGRIAQTTAHFLAAFTQYGSVPEHRYNTTTTTS